jgi:hypothetical protein
MGKNIKFRTGHNAINATNGGGFRRLLKMAHSNAAKSVAAATFGRR